MLKTLLITITLIFSDGTREQLQMDAYPTDNVSANAAVCTEFMQEKAGQYWLGRAFGSNKMVEKVEVTCDQE